VADDLANLKQTADAQKIDDAVNALLKIMKANQIERMTYLAISVGSFIALLFVIVWGLVNKSIDITAAAAMFGSTGVVGFCVVRILEVWKDCMKLLTSVIVGGVKQ
jgi:hypothetical protein